MILAYNEVFFFALRCIVFTAHCGVHNQDGPVGFMHVRFLVEEGVELLYIYELQVVKGAQRLVRLASM